MTTHFDMLRFCTSASALLDHWLSLSKNLSECPRKSDFSPTSLGAALPDVFLCLRRSDDEVEIRVAGSRTSEITQADQTGANLLDICMRDHVEGLKAIYNRMLEGTVAALSEHFFDTGYTRMVSRALHLPLLDQDGVPTFTVGVVLAMPHGQPADTLLSEATADNPLKVDYISLFDPDRPLAAAS